MIIRSAAALAVAVLCAGSAGAQEDVKATPACTHCGMDREKFASSRMVLEYDDGSLVGVCSVHCAAVNLVVTIDKAPASIRVADFASKKLIDAEKAVWVIGGKRPGVMTRRGKWAFEERASAEAFSKENGGAIASFDDAMKATYEDIWSDTKMIREKRKMARAQKAAGTH
jgi:nitrous oxide reductase accessory protein NosL